MKSLLIKTLSVSLLLSAAMPFDVQAVNYAKHASRLAISGLGIGLYIRKANINSFHTLAKQAAGAAKYALIGSQKSNESLAAAAEVGRRKALLIVVAGLGTVGADVVIDGKVSEKIIPTGVGAVLGAGVTGELAVEYACGFSGTLGLVTIGTVLGGAVGDAIGKIYWPEEDSDDQKK